MKKDKKSKEAAKPLERSATSDKAQTASEAIPQNEAGPASDAGDSVPSMMVGTSPQHDVYAEGREALAELCKETEDKLPAWLKLGRALVKARTEAMRLAETNKPEGKHYCKALNKILKRERLPVESGQRRDLFRIMEHQAEIEAFLESRERILNNPTSIIRAWRRTSCSRLETAPRRLPPPRLTYTAKEMMALLGISWPTLLKWSDLKGNSK